MGAFEICQCCLCGSYHNDIQKPESIHLDAMILVTGGTAHSDTASGHQEFGGYTVQIRHITKY